MKKNCLLRRSLAVLLSLSMSLGPCAPGSVAVFADTTQVAADGETDKEETSGKGILHGSDSAAAELEIELPEHELATKSNATASDALYDEDGFLLDGDVVNDRFDEEPDMSSAIVNEKEETAALTDGMITAESFFAVEEVDDVIITVSAPEGVFPPGAELFVEKVTDKEDQEKIEDAVTTERKKDNSVSASYQFDIKVLLNGEEIEPDTSKGNVQVSFGVDETYVNNNTSISVFHISEDEDTNLKAEEMETEISETAADGVPDAADLNVDETKSFITVETESFSYYVVEFTYNKLQYVLDGDSSVPLSCIMETLGLAGTVSDVAVSNEELFKAERRDEDWIITAVKAFSSEEWMDVTVGEMKYRITVTDDSTPPAKSLPTLTGNKRNDAVSIAYKQVGYKESGDNLNAYGLEFGKNGVPWCVYFVDWCMKKAGVSTYPITGSTTEMADYFMERGAYHNKQQEHWKYGGIKCDLPVDNEYVPRPGDYAAIENKGGAGDGPDHTGMVVAVDNSWIYTVEGNISDSVVQCKYDISTYIKSGSTSYISGFGSPDFGDESKSFQFWGELVDKDNIQISGNYKFWWKEEGYSNCNVKVQIDNSAWSDPIYPDDKGLFSLPVDTTQYSNGTHTIRAVLRDAGSEEWVSKTVIINNYEITFPGTELVVKTGESNTFNISVKQSLASQLDAKIGNSELASFTWGSSSTSGQVITVPVIIKGLKAGVTSFTINQLDESNNILYSKSVTLRVRQSVTGVSLNKSSMTLPVGSSETLTATVAPSNAYNKVVTWSSNNTSVATVSSTGAVKGIAPGTAKITVTTKDGGKTAACNVTVEPAGTITFDQNQTTFTISAGKLVKIPFSYTGNGVSGMSTSAADEDIAYVTTTKDVDYSARTGNLCVCGLRQGSTTIMVKMLNSAKQVVAQKQVSIKVSGSSYAVTVSPSDLTVGVNETRSFTITYQGRGVYRQNVDLGSNCAEITGREDAEFDYSKEQGTIEFSLKGKTAGTTNLTVEILDRNQKVLLTRNFTVTVVVHPTGVSLNKASMSLEVGKTETLAATVAPSNATNKAVTWSSNNTSVATVSSTGAVKGIAPGTAKITVTTKDGGKTAVCNVTVVPAGSIKFDQNQTTFTISAGQLAKIPFTFTGNGVSGMGTNVADGDIAYVTTVKDVDYAAKTGNLCVCGLRQGSTTITVKMVNSSMQVVAQKQVTVKVSGSNYNVTIDPSDLTVGVNETRSFTITYQGRGVYRQNVDLGSNCAEITGRENAEFDYSKEQGTIEASLKGKTAGTTNLTVEILDRNQKVLLTRNFTVTVITKDPKEEFIKRLYRICMNREADEDGLKYWLGLINNGSIKGIALAGNFVFSQEFTSKNYCNEHFVKQIYPALMGREPDDEGLAYWSGELDKGMKRETLLNSFTSSNEYKKLCAEAGIELGSKLNVPKYGRQPFGPCAVCGEETKVAQFAERMYTVCLGRAAEPDGLAFWCKGLYEQTITGKGILNFFFLSNEIKGKNLSNQEYVRRIYKVMLDRDPDEDGLNYWVGRLDSGSSPTAVIAGFIDSQEFTKICSDYGIRRK